MSAITFTDEERRSLDRYSSDRGMECIAPQKWVLIAVLGGWYTIKTIARGTYRVVRVRPSTEPDTIIGTTNPTDYPSDAYAMYGAVAMIRAHEDSECEKHLHGA